MHFDNALEHIHDLSLTAEVAQFCEASHLFFIYQEEVRKIEERMWEAGQLKNASARRLEGANTLDRIEAAAEELDCMAVPQQVLTERGCSTWKGGDVMKRHVNAYYTVMTNVSK